MGFTILNSLLYLLLFIYTYTKHRTLSLGVVLTALYALVSIMCVATIKINIFDWSITLWPFIYLFIAFIISARSFINNDINCSNFKISSTKSCIAIVLIMTIAAIINIYYSIGSITISPIGDEFADIYNDKESIAQSSNTIDWISKNINSYFALPFSIVVFYLLSQESKSIIRLSLASLIIVFSALFINALSRGGRWYLVNYFSIMISGFLIQYKQINPNLRFKINLFICVFAIVFIAYLIIIAFSRFSSVGSTYGGDVNASLIYYSGHSMLTFNDGIADSIKRYLWGDFFIGSDYIQGKDIDPILGTHFGSRFFTYIGGFYLDFGPMLTLLLCVVIDKIIRRKRIIRDLSDAYLICFFYVFIFMGVFVHGRGYGLSWILCFVLYFILKIIK